MPPFKTLRFASGNRTLGLAGSAAAADAPTVAPETVVGRAAAAASPPLDFRKSRREVPAGTDEPGSGVGAAPRSWMVRLLMGLPPVDMGWWACGQSPQTVVTTTHRTPCRARITRPTPGAEPSPRRRSAGESLPHRNRRDRDPCRRGTAYTRGWPAPATVRPPASAWSRARAARSSERWSVPQDRIPHVSVLGNL